jgi:methionine-rich copper-binding protein CopC
MESAAYESLAEGNYQVQLRAVNSAGSSTAAIATVTVSKSSSGEPESSAGATTNPPANATTGPGGVITPGATGATTPSGKPVAVLPAKVSAQAGKATRTSITLNQPVLLKDLVLVLVNKAGKRSTVDATFKRSGSTKVIASYKAPTKAGSYTLVLYRKVGSKRVLLDSSRLVVKG